jgi:N-acyl-L-homoserine lactone synthetase
MATRIKLAETSEELDQLFQLRHQVFCEERGYAQPTHDGRLHDRFDAFPGVANFIAVVGGRVVGGMRIVEESGAGLPAHDYFDFTSRVAGGGDSRIGSVSMLVVHPAHRKGPLFFLLAGMGHSWAARRGLTHLVAPVSPDAEVPGRRLGYEALAPRFFHEGLRLTVTPLLLDMKRMSGHLAAFVARRQREQLGDDFARTFYRAGEVIARVGEPGDEAYLVVDGEVSVQVAAPMAAGMHE